MKLLKDGAQTCQNYVYGALKNAILCIRGHKNANLLKKINYKGKNCSDLLQINGFYLI